MAKVVDRSKKNKEHRFRRVLVIFMAVMLLAIISAAAAVLITNNGELNLDGLKRLFQQSGNKAEAAVFSFDTGAGSVYADLDGGLAVCSVAGLQVYDRNAALSFDEAFEMTTPAICTGGNNACVYDLGGTSVKVFNRNGIIYSLTPESRIISATLSDNGWLALCSESGGAYKGTVSVYDPAGKNVYKFDSALGYVLSAVVSPDQKNLAVLTLNETGTRIVFFSLDSTEEKAFCQLDGTLVLEIRYMNTGSVLAIGDGALSVVHPDGGSQQLMDYEGKYLANYTSESTGFTALVLNAYMVGDQGSIVTVDKTGNTLGSLQITQKVLWLSADSGNLAVLYGDGLVIYDRYLKERARFDETAGAVQAIMRSDDTALLVLAHSATVCTPSE